MLPANLMRSILASPQFNNASVPDFAPSVPTFDPLNVPTSEPVGMPRFPALGQIETINQGRNAALEAFRRAQEEELARARPQASFNLTDGALLALGLLFGGRERGDFAKSFLQGKVSGFQQRQDQFDTGRRERLGALTAGNEAEQAGFGQQLDSAQDALRAQVSEFERDKRLEQEQLRQDATTGRTSSNNETRGLLADKTTDRTKWKAQYDGFARVVNNPNLPAEVRADAARRMMDMVGEDPSLSDPTPMTTPMPSVPERNVAVKEKELPSRIAVNNARTADIFANVPLKKARLKYIEKQTDVLAENVAVDVALKWARIDDYKADNANAKARLDLDQVKARNEDLKKIMETASSQSNAIRSALASARGRLADAKNDKERAVIQGDINRYVKSLQTFRDLYTGATQALRGLPGANNGTGEGDVKPFNPMANDGGFNRAGVIEGALATPPTDKPKPKVPPKKPKVAPKKAVPKSAIDALKASGWKVNGQ